MRPPIKIHGGKFYLYKWIIQHFPPNYEQLEYVEPFIGAGSVLLNKKPSVKELAVDLDNHLITLWRTIRDRCQALQDNLNDLMYLESTFERAKTDLRTCVYMDFIDEAVDKYTIHRMSRGGLGTHYAWSDRKRGGMPGDVNAWNTSIKNLSNISKRIEDVNFEYGSAVHVLRRYRSNNAFIYCDPPYCHNTRTTKKAYKHEMTMKDHEELIDELKQSKCKVMISGYDNDLYNAELQLWNKVDRPIVNHSGQNKKKNPRLEVIWMNY